MKNKKILLSFILFIHVAAWFILKPVWPFSDDFCYSFHSFNLLEGNFNLSYNQFQNRLGVYVPQSIFLFLFGINPYTIALWPLLISCFTISIVFLFLDKLTNTTIATISSFLIAVNTIQITYSIAIFPDLIVSFYYITAILLLYHGRQQKSTVYPILLNVCLLIGFLTKETIVLIAPFLLVVFFYDVYKKQNTLFWKRTFLYGICSLLLLFLIYYLITGDAFFRFKALLYFNNNGLLDITTATNIKAHYSSNIFKWINSELGLIFIILILLYSILALKRKSDSDFYSFISIYAIILLLEFIFIFHNEKYGFLFLLNRIWMLTIAPLSIVSAFIIYKASIRFYIYLLIVFTGLCIYNLFFISFNRGILFGVFLITTTLSYYLKRKNEQWRLLLLVPFLVLSIYFVYSNSNYRVASLISGNHIKEQLEQLNNSNKKIILCEEAFSQNHIIYNGFKEYDLLTFRPYSKSDSVLKYSNVYVLVNTEETQTPKFIKQNAQKWNLIVNEKGLLIYKQTE